MDVFSKIREIPCGRLETMNYQCDQSGAVESITGFDRGVMQRYYACVVRKHTRHCAQSSERYSTNRNAELELNCQSMTNTRNISNVPQLHFRLRVLY